MYSSALIKDTLREIIRTLNRFLSLVVIVALGVGFFMGVKSTAPDMKLTADKYFDETRLMDVHLLSTMGFDEEDMRAIKAQEGFDSIMPSYSTDAIMKRDGTSVVVKVLALPDKRDSVGETLNNPVLISGRLPEKSGECVVEQNSDQKPYQFKIGDTITFETEAGDKPLSDSLKKNVYTVVGFVDSPQYIAIERGSSNIGDGSIGYYMMIPRDDFSFSVFTDVYLSVKGLKDASAFDAYYTDEVNRFVKKMEELGLERADARYNQITDDAAKDINDAKAELADAEKEKDEKLGKALEEIESGERSVQDAEADSARKLSNARAEIDRGKKDIAAAEAKLAKSEQEYNNKIAKSEAELAAGKKEYATQKANYDKQYAEFQKTKAQADKEIASAQQDLDDLQQQINALEAAIRIMEDNGVPPDDPNLVSMKTQLAAMKKQHADGEAQLAQKKAELAAAERQLAQAKAQLDASKAQLDQSEAELNRAKTDGQNELNAARADINKSKQELAQAEIDYNRAKINAQKEINAAKADLQQGKNQYNQNKLDAEKEIEDARAKILDAEEELEALQKPKWYVQSRKSNPGYSGFEDNANRIDAVATVFPVFFLMVAAMVCLTTMNRMVDEQRMQIGTLKAMGYSKFAIACKYFVYAALASLLGSVTGCAVGFWLFPTVIYNAYDIMYCLPALSITFQWVYALISALVAILCTVTVALGACYNALMSHTSVLMRPKPPKSGRRIFLERIRFIWSRMGFISKVTARNILRYKARFFMAVLGIAGCTALMLSGFGLKDSISVIVPVQFDQLYAYDTVIGLKDEVNGTDAGSLKADLAADPAIQSALLTRQKVMDAKKGDRKVEIRLLVPEDASRLPEYITLRHMTDQKPVRLSDDGVIITEKLANMLGVSAGDTFLLKKEETTVRLKISDVAENYIYHYVYMSPKLYQEAFATAPAYNAVIGKMKAPDDSTEKALASAWLQKDNILSVNFTTGVSEDFQDSLKSLNTVVLVLILSAGCLAFVVVYNLTNINICERQRELATMKVLGFNNKEVSNFVYRENLVLTIIGVILGLGLGIVLHGLVVQAAEVDIVMYGKNILPMSYLYSVIITFAFTLLVNFAMYFRLKSISMVDSLKSVE
ncbi:MAG: FtsX-like permease family protein [Bacillota bacterium]